MGLFTRDNQHESREVVPVETRDPQAATQSLRYLSPGRAAPPDWDAETAFQVAYYQSIVVYACVRLAANTIASLPFRAGLDPNRPHDYNPNARLAKLLGPPPGGPAPNLSARRLWAWTVAQRIVTGRNGWEAELNGDQIAALWPLASSALVPVPSENGVNWFKGYVYGRVNDPNKSRDLRLEQVIYDWDPSGTDFRQPESALQAANLSVSTSIMQGKYDFAFLKNDARPPAIVVTEQFADEDDFDAFKRQWNSTHSGPDNAGKVAFLEAQGAGDQGVKGAVDVTVLGISQKDAQTAQRFAASMEHTAIALGTPWSLLDASGRTYDNAGVEWKTYVTHRVAPLCADLADMVNMQLAPRLGNEVGWFDMSRLGIEAMDRVDALGASTLFSADLATKNEARAPFGLAPIPGEGDKFASELGLSPMETKPTGVPILTPVVPEPPVQAASPAGEERKMHAYVDEDGYCAVCAKPAVHQSHGYFLPRSPEIERRESGSESSAPVLVSDEQRAEQRARIWRTTDGKVRNLEKQWERAVKKLFARQGRSAVARLEGKRGRALVRTQEVRATADEVFDPAHWLAETIDDVTALYEAVTAAGGARVSDLFGLAFDLEAPYAQDFIAARAKQLAGQVTDTTYQAIQDALREGAAGGEGIPELATRIRGVFSAASDVRAKTIARTETISAFNGSASLTAQEYGSDVVAGQEWIAEQDDRTRESHSELDGTIIGMDETFDNGLAYPGDPSGDPEETVNCRCTVGFLTPDEMGSRSGGRVVPLRMARSLIAMVRPGEYDEKVLRRALEVAA